MCSLIANVDRLSFSVLWEITPTAEIVGTRFAKSVIHSHAAMAYWQAQEFIDRKYVMLLACGVFDACH
jgi:exosome complex exonuclease DIS3/RRP44